MTVQRAERAVRNPAVPARRAAPSGAGLAWCLPVAGAAADELATSAPGWGLTVGAVLAAAVSAARCSRAGAWWVVPAPPLVVAVVTVAAELVSGGTGHHGKSLSTAAAHWAVDAFPAMAAAEATVLAVLTVRALRARRRRG
ncbi:DUF6542 domain-containing protein [Streptomyces sp. RPT161]|uniref:DUF6542 domain-containing protein n=1 Tax=Streptomyces sp. RPT161 TaxID=3015993 RepID=UPI0022B90C9C|nr:DUF6542 domain-containing protein [Streptomyces sp. RPT161]